jgi:hypothetical protein
MLLRQAQQLFMLRALLVLMTVRRLRQQAQQLLRWC